METKKSQRPEPVGAATHVIERPRLINLMEDSGARVVVLHAPAGYGKTTLARQWCGGMGRKAIWLRCTAATSDVAVLAIALANALSRVVPNAGADIVRRVRSTSDPARVLDSVQDALVARLDQWPRDAWLIVDDYHNASSSRECDALVERVVLDTSVQLLLTSRERPSWASTRRVLYGEILGLDQRHLSFTEDEAREILGPKAEAFEEVTRGWPAMVMLAAHVGSVPTKRTQLPRELYDFLAEELYQEAPAEVQQALLCLAVAPSLDADLVELILGNGKSTTVLADCVRLGFVQIDSAETAEIHPLLRSFLIEKLKSVDTAEVRALPNSVGLELLKRGRWDDTFLVHLSFPDAGLFLPLLEASIDPLIQEGRLGTVAHWLEYARETGVRGPLIDLAAAKLAFRRGDHSRAEILASTAAYALSKDEARRASAFITAGQAAILGDRTRVGRDFFKQARIASRSTRDRREALIGEFFAALELEDDDAPAILGELEQGDLGRLDASTRIRLATARLLLSASFGNMDEAIAESRPLRNLVDRVDDAYATTSFLSALAGMSTLAARYEHALDAAREAVRIGKDAGLDFAVPHARTLEAAAEMGLRNYAAAARILGEVDRWARVAEDSYGQANGRVFTARLLLMQGRSRAALDLLSASSSASYVLGLQAEHRAIKALGFACAGDRRSALATIETVTSRRAEARTVGFVAKAVVDLQGSGSAARSCYDCMRVAVETGNFDSIVLGYRAYPRLLPHLAEHEDHRAPLGELLERSRDVALGKKSGVIAAEPLLAADLFSPREHDVLSVLCDGLGNEDIARQLFISPSTVKVHLRHIYEKLGVHTRAQAIVRARELTGD
jgi:LuxR family transcriptional regulator, maltose regulon positive regulatory protein